MLVWKEKDTQKNINSVSADRDTDLRHWRRPDGWSCGGKGSGCWTSEDHRSGS